MFQLESGWGIVLRTNASSFEQIMQVNDISKGILSLLNGRSSPKPVTLPIMFRVLYWGILMTTLPFLCP